jgi:hypothetical protein
MPELLVYTGHAVNALREREIPREWVERTIRKPLLVTPDIDDPEVERFYLRISENGDRVLRVAVNTTATPWRVVSAFFDRTMRGRL